MSTFIIVSLASLGLLAILGTALVFSHLCGLASESLVRVALQNNGSTDPHVGDAPPPTAAQLTDMAEIQRIEAVLRDHGRAMKSTS